MGKGGKYEGTQRRHARNFGRPLRYGTEDRGLVVASGSPMMQFEASALQKRYVAIEAVSESVFVVDQ